MICGLPNHAIHNDLQSPSGLFTYCMCFKIRFLYSYAAVDKISTDTVRLVVLYELTLFLPKKLFALTQRNMHTHADTCLLCRCLIVSNVVWQLWYMCANVTLLCTCDSFDHHIWITLSGWSRNYSQKCSWYTSSSHVVQSRTYSSWSTFILFTVFFIYLKVIKLIDKVNCYSKILIGLYQWSHINFLAVWFHLSFLSQSGTLTV